MAKQSTAEQGAILQRQLQALELRKRGLSYRAIGEKLEVDHTTAYKDVMKELSRLAKERDGKLEELRQLELERLDMLLLALEPMARVGDTSAVTAYLKTMERRAKYLGLDAPEKHEYKDLSKLSDDELRAIAEGKGSG